MRENLDLVFLGNTVLDYLVFLGSLALSLILLTVIKRVLLREISVRAKEAPASRENALMRGARKYLLPLMYISALYLNAKWLSIPDSATRVADIAALALAMILGSAFLCNLLEFIFGKHLDQKNRGNEKSAMIWFRALVRTFVWTCTLLLFLENQNIEITAIVAGLGIGGIAIAFAAQTILEDIFSFVSIIFDRPFELGDFIAVDDMLGSVEHIGIKTTRLRSLSGEQLVFSNKDLTSSRVKNYKRMERRRAVFAFGVKYDTSGELLREMPGIIRKIIESIENAVFDRAHFKAFGEFSLDFEVVYYVDSRDYSLYMDIQQSINLRLKEALENRGVQFALSTHRQNINESEN
ncbi:MAG: mechanosensitive ion channel family protein [Christensenellales bacterium]